MFALLGLGLVTACGASPTDAGSVEAISPDCIIGNLTRPAHVYERVLATCPEKIIMRPRQTDPFTALDLAEGLRSYNGTVQYAGLCAKFCASIVLPASQTIEFAPGAQFILAGDLLRQGKWSCDEGLGAYLHKPTCAAKVDEMNLLADRVSRYLETTPKAFALATAYAETLQQNEDWVGRYDAFSRSYSGLTLSSDIWVLGNGMVADVFPEVSGQIGNDPTDVSCKRYKRGIFILPGLETCEAMPYDYTLPAPQFPISASITP